MSRNLQGAELNSLTRTQTSKTSPNSAAASTKRSAKSILRLTGATLYLLEPLTGEQSVLGKHCSAKTQQHMKREARILSAIGSRDCSRRRLLRCCAESQGCGIRARCSLNTL
ncbi:hypothetical protein D4764_05G0009070 [Takifugu flavidus]|uniref:Uncharacterized protein n=1 Tax=Takifugu flavidus TaxID=433684 RepID=A0A5C6N4Z1_9TELE|nr:hypothetical protein D4764_05G0009070 [Takifugu flavidus]